MRKMSLRIVSVLALLGLAFVPLGGELNRWGFTFVVFAVVPVGILFGGSFIKNRILHVLLTCLAAVLGILGMSFLLVTAALNYGAAYLFCVSEFRMLQGVWLTWLFFWILLFMAIAGKKAGKRMIPALTAGTVFVVCLLAAGAVFIMDRMSSPDPSPEEGGSAAPYDYTQEDISQDEETGIFYVNNIVMVFFEPDTSKDDKQAVVEALNGEAAGEEEVIDLMMIRVEASSYAELEALCEEVRQMEGVQEATTDLAAPVTSNYEPNDPFGKYWYNALWTDNTWDVDAPSGNNWWAEAIDAPAAWDHRKELSPVSVGVVDSGVDAGHEDLSITLLNEELNVPSESDHGTHVSGLIGAAMDNEKGIAGVAPNARMLGWDLQPSDAQQKEGGWDTTSSLLSGIVASVEEGGARTIVNLSQGLSPGGLKEETGSDILSDEQRWAHGARASAYMSALLIRGYDFVIVQSAGNGNAEDIGYDSQNNGLFCNVTEENCETFGGKVEPQAILDRIIIVAAAERPNKDGEYTLCDFSNYGDRTTLAAPGDDIYSTVKGKYGEMSGTSMAAPITAGAAAAVWGAQPGLSGAQIKGILLDTAQTQVAPNKATEASKEDALPLLNVGEAVEKALGIEAENTDKGIYEKYIKAAKVTTVQGKWTENVYLDMEIQVPDGSDRDTVLINAQMETEISDYDREDISSVRLKGEGYSSGKEYTSWEMTYAKGVASYVYSEPTEQKMEQEIQPEIFDFFNLQESSLLDGAIDGDEITFWLSRESLEAAAGTTLTQLLQDDGFAYEKAAVTARIDPSSGQLLGQTIEITGTIAYEGSEQPAECVLDYAFEAEEMDYGELTPGNGDMSEERDIVLVLDNSGSMAESVAEGSSSEVPIEETREAALKFVDTVLKEDASIGIVTYNNDAAMRSDFSKDQSFLEAAAYSIRANGGTDIEAGLSTAQEMLSYSSAKKKSIVLMSDGMPNDGKQGEELISYADSLKGEDIEIYTLGFFSSLESEDKAAAQSLLSQIASEGHHYEVDDAENLVFFFEDIADAINGQQYIYIKIACPVDVTVRSGGETLSSKEEDFNTRTAFGTLTFEEGDAGESVQEESAGEERSGFFGQTQIGDTGAEEAAKEDDRVKILRLKEGTKYDVQIEGTGDGSMDYTIGFMDEDGEYADFREFEDIEINEDTKINTVAENASKTVLKVDEDGDGRYDLQYRAGENENGELIDHSWIRYVIIGAAGVIFALLGILALRHWKKKKKTQ